jgi:uncharacterized membrane protein
MRRFWKTFALLAAVLSLLSLPLPVVAQTGPDADDAELVLFTDYPSQVIGFDESPSIKLTLRTGTEPQIVDLEMEEIPEGWTATFRGGSVVIRSVYVEPEKEATVNLKLEPPANVTGGTHEFVVLARGDGTTARLPLELTVQERVPARLTLDTDLPTVRGKPSTTFRYSARLENEGDEEVTVNLLTEAPTGFLVTVKTGGNEVTSLPLEANSTKTLSIEADPFLEIPAGSYPIAVRAEGGGTTAALSLVAEVTGEAELTVTAPDGRLSGEAYAGEETPLKVIVRNTGSAPARGIEMGSSEPAGWSVTFDPQQIGEIPAGQEVEVTANIQPADEALTGDYMVTVRARPEGGGNESAEFRITVLTSTLWGIVGVALIAVAVGVVALAVLRFGRR